MVEFEHMCASFSRKEFRRHLVGAISHARRVCWRENTKAYDGRYHSPLGAKAGRDKVRRFGGASFNICVDSIHL